MEDQFRKITSFNRHRRCRRPFVSRHADDTATGVVFAMTLRDGWRASISAPWRPRRPGSRDRATVPALDSEHELWDAELFGSSLFQVGGAMSSLPTVR